MNIAKAYLNHNGAKPLNIGVCSDWNDFLDSGGSDLIQSLADNATSAYETSVVSNANPLNAALITGGQATTPYGSTTSLAPASIGASGIWLFLIAAVVIFFALRS